MALRATGRRYGWEGELGSDVGVIGLRGGYHGDTVSPSFVNDLISDWLNGCFRGKYIQQSRRLV